ncbi:MAG: helix-turn-helix domain-containing protein [Chloroflexi bacterium]|nr:MAG: helix-turn-helix domain-containing protein [Chloroflexota bacterium]
MGTLLSTKQLIDLLNIDRTTVYRMLKDGRLTGIKVGNQWRFSRDEVEALLSGDSTDGQLMVAVENQPAVSIETIPLKCAQSMQDFFAEVLNVGAVTTDPTGYPITMISNSCRFCHLILSTETGQQACIESWRRLAEMPKNRTAFATCHAGLQYTRRWIEITPQSQAMLVAGQYYTQKPDSVEEGQRIQRLAATHGLNPQEMKAAASEIVVLDTEQQAGIGKWLNKAVRTFEEIGKERLELVNQLRNFANISAQGLGETK